MLQATGPLPATSGASCSPHTTALGFIVVFLPKMPQIWKVFTFEFILVAFLGEMIYLEPKSGVEPELEHRK